MWSQVSLTIVRGYNWYNIAYLLYEVSWAYSLMASDKPAYQVSLVDSKGDSSLSISLNSEVSLEVHLVPSKLAISFPSLTIWIWPLHLEGNDCIEILIILDNYAKNTHFGTVNLKRGMTFRTVVYGPWLRTWPRTVDDGLKRRTTFQIYRSKVSIFIFTLSMSWNHEQYISNNIYHV